MARGRRRYGGVVPQPHVQPAGDIQTRLDGRYDGVRPMPGQHAARIGDPDHKCPGSGRHGRVDAHVGDVKVRAAAGQAHLAEAPFLAPVRDAMGGLGGQLVGDIAEKHEIRRGDLHAWLRLCVLSAKHGTGIAPFANAKDATCRARTGLFTGSEPGRAMQILHGLLGEAHTAVA
jgi:hypothetical protein